VPACYADRTDKRLLADLANDSLVESPELGVSCWEGRWFVGEGEEGVVEIHPDHESCRTWFETLSGRKKTGREKEAREVDEIG
jgi:hypothetical protein